MTRKKQLTIEQIEVLRSTTESENIFAQLESYSHLLLSSPKVILSYHDLLLFYCAYPPTSKIVFLANAELERLTNCIKKSKHLRQKNALMGSGIAYSTLNCLYSKAIAHWLQTKFSEHISFNADEALISDSRNIIQALAPDIEYQKTSQGELRLISRLKSITGLHKPNQLLSYLFQLFNDSPLPESIKEILYGKLKVYLIWTLEDKFFSRSFLRWPINRYYFQQDFIKKVNSHSIVNQSLEKPLLLTSFQKMELLYTMKASLALQYRETDPITYGDEEEIELFDMGRGLLIALVGMIKEKRLSLETYIGYMAFKNGLPISYGGGWIWGQRCKMGINLFPPFRGGESAWVFCQILRVYRQYYGALHFIVKPYQFGKGNPEGIKSGAFWFYFKLGFRHENKLLQKETEKEWNKIIMNAKYRTTQKKLIQFTKSNIEWILNNDCIPDADASNTSLAISSLINKQFSGNRKKAVEVGLQNIKRLLANTDLPIRVKSSSHVIENWGLLITLINKMENWTQKDKKALANIIQIKQSGKEREYVLQLQKHTKLMNALSLKNAKIFGASNSNYSHFRPSN